MPISQATKSGVQNAALVILSISIIVSIAALVARWSLAEDQLTAEVTTALRHYFFASKGGGNEAVVHAEAQGQLMESLSELSTEMPGNSAHAFVLGLSAEEARRHLCPTAPETIGDKTVILEYAGFVPNTPLPDRWQAYAYIDNGRVCLFMTR